MTLRLPTVDDPQAVDRLLRLVQQRTGFDLTGYRQEGLVRRLWQRVGLAGYEDLAAFSELVAVDDTEAWALLHHLLVQVSAWFRDPPVWDSLRSSVLTGLGGPVGDRPVRAWVAGCGEGQEVYSLAACLAEARVEGHLAAWWVLATDVDMRALRLLAGGRYPRAGLPDGVGDVLRPHLREEGPSYRVGSGLTANVSIGHHDVRDAPPEDAATPFDLVVCRNLLMYLDEATQNRVLDGLIASLRPGGVLVLGQAELPMDRRDALVPVDLAARIYRSIAAPLSSS